MKTSKNLLAAAIVTTMALGAVPAAIADIDLGEGLKVTGFVDMSFLYTDPDAGDSESVFAIDQVETSFIYTGSNGLSAQVDIEYGESGNGSGLDETFVEQAFVTKQVNDNLSIKAGRFLSYSGWETEEPTGLFQYSGTGYAKHFYGYYQQGISAYYDAGVVDVMASVVNSAFNPVDSNSEKLATEFGIAVQPSENFTAKAFYISDDETDLVNVWASYSVSNFTFAAEYNQGDYGDQGDKKDGDGFLVMANYAAENWGFTARYHDYTIENNVGGIYEEGDAITLAPSLTLSDNVLFVAEYRMDGGSYEGDSLALEVLFTF